MREVPRTVRNKARSLGQEAWLDALPELVGSLEREWSITVGRTLEGGTEAFVAEAVQEDGCEAVLKLLIPRTSDDARHEIEFLRRADGDGCARLLRHDVGRSALLLERLGTPLCDLELPLTRRLEILCDACKRIWRPAPDASFRTGAEKGRWLASFVADSWEQLGRPCSESAVAYALACVERRIAAHDDERAVLVHGDVHQWNALALPQGPDAGFKLIDPDGLLAEAEYDLGILMREDPVPLLQGDPYERARRLAAWTGRDATAIWEWGAIERVSTGLVATRIDLQPEARQMLEAADLVARR